MPHLSFDRLSARNPLGFSSCFASQRPLPLGCIPFVRPKKRFGHCLPLDKVLSAPRSSSNGSLSRAKNFDLVSTTEYSDGSVVFHFEDVIEIAKNAEIDKPVFLHEDAGPEVIHEETIVGISEKVELEFNHELRQSKCGSIAAAEVNSIEKIAIQGQSSGHHRNEVIVAVTEDSDPGSKPGDDYSAFVNVEATEDRGESSLEMISYKIITTDSKSKINDFVEREISSDDKEATPVAINSGLDMVSSEELSQEDSEGELIINLSSSTSISTVELHKNLASHGNKLNSSSEFVHVSRDRKDHEAQIEEKCVTDHDVDSGTHTSEVVPELSLLKSQSVLTEETSHSLVDVLVDHNQIESFKLEEVPSSISEENSGKDDAASSHGLELQMGGTCNDREDILMTELVLCSGTASLPHPIKAFAGGKDFCFVYQNWIGIADGAGEWSLEGTHAGLYAQELIKNCEKIVSESKSMQITDPVDVLCQAAARTESSGLSTALITYFDGQALHVANIGNSGFMIVRNGIVSERSFPMVHEFNFPLQLKRGYDPSELLKKYKLDLNEGDVIITATNGLFDNLYEQELASSVSESLQMGSKPQQIGKLLATKAHELGQSALVRTPFADAAQAAGYEGITGGKLDDVTVIVSLVQNSSALLQ